MIVAKAKKVRPGKLLIINKQKKMKDPVTFNFSQIRRKIIFLYNSLGLTKFNLYVSFTSDNQVQKLNYSSRGIDKPTDVISIPYYEQVLVRKVSNLPQLEI